MARRVKGTPTHVNIYALSAHFEGRNTAPNRMTPTRRPHIARCLAAGRVVVDESQACLRLTDAGRAAIEHQRLAVCTCSLRGSAHAFGCYFYAGGK